MLSGLKIHINHDKSPLKTIGKHNKGDLAEETGVEPTKPVINRLHRV